MESIRALDTELFIDENLPKGLVGVAILVSSLKYFFVGLVYYPVLYPILLFKKGDKNGIQN